MGEFADKVFEIVRQIPEGRVTTYGRIAQLMGRPQSGRYVGFALRGNPNPGADDDAIPCHRVVFKDGRLCDGFAFGGPDVQRALLESEGVAFADDTHVDLEACIWDGGSPDTSSNSVVPITPPESFDWEAELGER